jgi:hypothetical protein
MTPCSLIDEYQHFGGAKYFHLYVTLSLMMECIRRWRRMEWTLFCCFCYVFIVEFCRVERKMCLFNGTLISFWEFTRSFKWSVCVGVATQYEMSGLNATAPIPNPTWFFHLRFPPPLLCCFLLRNSRSSIPRNVVDPGNFSYTACTIVHTHFIQLYLHNLYSCIHIIYLVVLTQLIQLYMRNLFSCTYTTYTIVHAQFTQLYIHSFYSCT